MNQLRRELVATWRAAGIEDGNVVLVHSSLKPTILRCREKGMDCTPTDILESFIAAVGQKGTLLLPTFNINVQPLVRFDIRHSPSKMGIVTEIARQREDFLRTRHPVLSFAVHGRLARDFERCDDYTGIGHQSVFARLHVEDGLIAILNLRENDSMSFYHHVERTLGVDYRWTIDFEAEVTDGQGCYRRKHGFYARKRDDGVVTSVDRMGERLWQQGCYCGDRWNEGSGLRTIRAHDVFRHTVEVIRDGEAKSYLYTRDNAGDKL